ncbi:M48 family metallopeptidase [Methylomonas sp. SURF-2]|uniref:M48 family metallopeptidase n=1 Tax=Methylomonas subterranea TaxID=2952225 RepID=A0ABT1TIK5_9GAMM|nr:SprT family zinc-dependent metalloprotease [Methylomonas sp. SURF-2]MCQ8105306.1 M48 family metallopeptidase [Methylomonas sp. SURF-2]
MPQVKIGSLSLQLNRKAIKNLHISVLPPDGRIRVSAPEKMTDTAIRMAVVSRIPWIKKQQRDFAAQPRQSDREMVSGECHYFWGKRHRLNLVERVGRHEVKVSGGKIHLFVNPGTSVENRALVLSEFYRTQLKTQIEKLMPYWRQRMAVELAGWSVKKMKTKWGSCNIDAKRIWLNLELAKKPAECLEYILVHELVHLLERKHNERFRAHMDKFMPNWRERRDILNKLPLAFESWSY